MSDLLSMTPTQFCDATNACEDGREWALTQPTMTDVWPNIEPEVTELGLPKWYGGAR